MRLHGFLLALLSLVPQGVARAQDAPVVLAPLAIESQPSKDAGDALAPEPVPDGVAPATEPAPSEPTPSAASARQLAYAQWRIDELTRKLEALEHAAAARDAQAAAEDDEARRAAAAVGDFPGAMRIGETKSFLRIGGYAQLSATLSWGALPANSSSFVVAAIAPRGGPAAKRDARTVLSAGQSRLNLEFRTPTEAGLLRTFLEGDFVTTAGVLRLRHAYGDLSGLLLGQTWSAFIDTSTLPDSIDVEGVDGALYRFQPTARWTQPIGEHVAWTLSVEAPSTRHVSTPTSATMPLEIERADRVPDTITRVRVSGDPGHVQLALIARELRVAQTANPSVHAGAFGYGANLSALVLLPRLLQHTRLLVQATAGRGVGRYMIGTASAESFGDPTDALYDTRDNTLTALGVFGGMVSVQQGWTPRWRSSLTAGGTLIDILDAQPGTAMRRTNYFSLNLIYQPIDRIDIGIEQIVGVRGDRNHNLTYATQTQLGSWFRF